LISPASVLVLASTLLGRSERHFTFHYGFTVKGIPPGEKVQIWIPAAHSDTFEDIRLVSTKGDLPLEKTHESVYGNEMYHAPSSKAKELDLQFEIVYDVVRREHLTLGIYAPHLAALTLNRLSSAGGTFRRDCRLRLLGGILRSATPDGFWLRGVETSRTQGLFFWGS
jgi:hypothetical protein